ncbi:four helix bundle protein [Candidatus Peregrinibacteria bacterium CG_4_10_14_0_2_um_filter_43_11]|nr:MAG: four helix bundle protein [Candidatus Peregrinibacteria bacterium CG_4_10_14_0_2_um_filter_43_11]
MQYKTFEEIPVWQSTRDFVAKIYRITENQFKKDFGLMDQLRRASVSILLNISEGFERKTNIDFARFINQAKGSSGECRAVFYIALDNGYITQIQFDELVEKAISISRQLSKFGSYLTASHAKK